MGLLPLSGVLSPLGGARKAAGPPGWWLAGGASGCVAAYQPKGAASYAASKLDLSGNGNNASEGSAPTWDAVNGWTFDGVSQYLLTGVIPVPNVASMLIQFSGETTLFGTLAGSRSGSGGTAFSIEPFSFGFTIEWFSGGSAYIAPDFRSGNVALAGRHGYRNGVEETGVLSSWLGAADTAITIGALNNFGAIIQFCAASIKALALYINDIGASAVGAVSTAMAAL